MEESEGPEGLEFKWGKKRSVGGKNKDVQFYESFTYDGDEYCLYDCVLVCDKDSIEPFIGMIVKIFELADKRTRRVKLLWFFKPSEISPYLEGVPDILENELFLASGEGRGLANLNPLEAIGGKCSVVCISNDKRNPQPSDEEINSADFVFRRTFDVGRCKVVDTIDNKIAGVDVLAVKFIFNRACCQKEATGVQNVEADIDGNLDSLKPNGHLATSVSVRKIEDRSTESYDCKQSGYGRKQKIVNGHNQLATEKSTFAEERSNNDSGFRRNLCDGKAPESEVKKQYIKQKSMPAEDKYRNSCEVSGSRVIHSNTNKAYVNDVKRQLAKQKSMPAEERYRKELNKLEHRPPKKQKLDGSVTVPDGRAGDRMLVVDNKRNYQVFEVSQKPDAAKTKWFRNLPWEETMRDAEKKGTVVLLQNLDPTYASDEVEDIVYSALNEKCEARMIERTSVTNPHTGEALVIFKTREAAERVVERLDEGCLLLSNGRSLVAAFAKITPPGKPSSFLGHIILHKTQTRREMRDALATSHCSQPNNLEFDMAMEWCLHQDRYKQISETLFKRQLEEKKSLRIYFKPKLP